jgi:hypothetical protein
LAEKNQFSKSEKEWQKLIKTKSERRYIEKYSLKSWSFLDELSTWLVNY